MEGDPAERRSIFYPFGMVGAWSIIGATVVIMGIAQVVMLPQGSGFPEDPDFWRPVAPFAAIALIAFGLSRVCDAGTVWRDGFLSGAIASGAWSIGFGLMVFATGERLGIDDFVQATPVAPENSYTCTRKADGGMDCRNELGEAAPGYSYTVVTPKKAAP